MTKLTGPAAGTFSVAYPVAREPINVNPHVRARLRRLLRRYEMMGVGYSEFIDRAVAAAEDELRVGNAA